MTANGRNGREAVITGDAFDRPESAGSSHQSVRLFDHALMLP
jgi:hypothetical protein